MEENRHADMFDALAATAEAIAETADNSAEVHNGMTQHLPAAGEHAARDRRLAEAERAAAAAFGNHEVPPEDVRQAIRDVRAAPGDQ
jgi:anti-sigma factor RsiW